ncbi:MAG: hypothetical protein AAFX85_08465 [Pseudomonadota bacterium]
MSSTGIGDTIVSIRFLRPGRPLPRLLALALLGALIALASPFAGAADGERKLTPREAAELRYADRVMQRGFQRMAASQWKLARKDFYDAIKSISFVNGEQDPRVAEIYVMSARTRFTQAVQGKGKPGPMTAAREEFDKAIAIYEALPAPHNEPLLDTYIQYGDLLQVASAHDAALEVYYKGWDMMVDRTSQRAANDFFKRATNLMDMAPNRGYRSSEDQIVWFTFDVDPQGRIADLEDKGSTAGKKLMHDMERLLDRARFRPRFVDREPQSMRGFIKLRFPNDGSRPQDLPNGA